MARALRWPSRCRGSLEIRGDFDAARSEFDAVREVAAGAQKTLQGELTVTGYEFNTHPSRIRNALDSEMSRPDNSMRSRTRMGMIHAGRFLLKQFIKRNTEYRKRTSSLRESWRSSAGMLPCITTADTSPWSTRA